MKEGNHDIPLFVMSVIAVIVVLCDVLIWRP